MQRASWTRTLALIVVAAAPLCLGPASAHAQANGGNAAAPDEASVKKAQSLFLKGSDLYKAKKFEQALDAFKQSYATVASPNSHLYIARCLADMGRRGEAYLEYEKVIEEATERAKTEERYAPTRDQAKTERDDVGAKIALVTVNVANADPGTTVKIGETEVPQAQWGKPFPVEPGTVEASAQSGGQSIGQQTLTLAAGDKRDLAFDAKPAIATPAEVADTSGKKSSLRPIAYVAGGVGLVGLGMFTAFGLMSQSTYSDLKDNCGTGPCPASFSDQISTGKTQQTLANVGLVVGIVGAAAGVTLFVLSSKSSKSDEPPPASARVVVGPSYAGVHGQF